MTEKKDYKYKKLVTLDPELVEKSKGSDEFNKSVGEYILSLARSCPDMDEMEIRIIKASPEEVESQAERDKKRQEAVDKAIKETMEEAKKEAMNTGSVVKFKS